MRICYIILTCEPFLKSRCEWQKRTWLSQVGPTHDYFFLSAKANPDGRVLGWNTADDYTSCPIKYLALLRSTAIDASAYDWIFICDDDTYVFHDRLVAYLENLKVERQETPRLYVGHILCEGYAYMSGGAGFAFSSQLFQDLSEYARDPNNAPAIHRYGDVSVGYWIHDVVQSGKEIVLVHEPQKFNGSPHRDEKEIDDAITFHYVREDLFDFYFSQSKIATATA
jgi:hypothetical protein